MGLGFGSPAVKVSDHGRHVMSSKPSTTKDPPCLQWYWNDARVKSVESSNVLPLSSDEEDTCVGAPFSNLPHHVNGTTLKYNRFNGHHAPTRWIFSGTRLELMTRWPRVRCLDH
ncbi:hypothetical protein TNCV_4624221 [Trichonephila clavipes]|nr:hypothetical protein TNCV_4624221 [Trichonephila clavipes]